MKLTNFISVLLSVFLFAGIFSGCSSVDEDRVFTKRVLFTGDSITEGALGRSYIELLREQYPDYELVNLGQDGDTVYGIMNRTVEHLKQDNHYDLIVIAAGHNDIILPDFAAKTNIHRMIVSNLEKSGSIPAADYNEFISTYSQFIDSIRGFTAAPIIITTLSCLNEDLSTSTNRQRTVYNRGIRLLASEKSAALADVAEVFDSRLRGLDCRNYFMDDLFDSVLFDKGRTGTAEGAAELSRKRSLHFTIDGIHMNPAGADIYSSVLAEVFNTLETLKDNEQHE